MKTVEVDAAVRYNIVIDKGILPKSGDMIKAVSYTHLRAHET